MTLTSGFKWKFNKICSQQQIQIMWLVPNLWLGLVPDPIGLTSCDQVKTITDMVPLHRPLICIQPRSVAEIPGAGHEKNIPNSVFFCSYVSNFSMQGKSNRRKIKLTCSKSSDFLVNNFNVLSARVSSISVRWKRESKIYRTRYTINMWFVPILKKISQYLESRRDGTLQIISKDLQPQTTALKWCNGRCVHKKKLRDECFIELLSLSSGYAI